MAADQLRLLDAVGAGPHPSDISPGGGSAVPEARLLGCGHRLSSLGSSTQSAFSFAEAVVCSMCHLGSKWALDSQVRMGFGVRGMV